MSKLDLTKNYKAYYTAKTKPELVNIEPAQFISITGKGDPAGKDFSDRIQALYTVAYTIKFIFKAQDKDFTVPKLEALWWFDEKKFGQPSMAEAPLKIPRSEWEYRLLIRLPHFVSEKEVVEAKKIVLPKKQLTLANEVALFKMEEGKCVQMLHIGPFDKEPETLTKMFEFISSQQLGKNGLHHEIYLSDFRKVPPEKLKTILREPVH